MHIGERSEFFQMSSWAGVSGQQPQNKEQQTERKWQTTANQLRVARFAVRQARDLSITRLWWCGSLQTGSGISRGITRLWWYGRRGISVGSPGSRVARDLPDHPALWCGSPAEARGSLVGSPGLVVQQADLSWDHPALVVRQAWISVDHLGLVARDLSGITRPLWWAPATSSPCGNPGLVVQQARDLSWTPGSGGTAGAGSCGITRVWWLGDLSGITRLWWYAGSISRGIPGSGGGQSRNGSGSLVGTWVCATGSGSLVDTRVQETGLDDVDHPAGGAWVATGRDLWDPRLWW